MGAAGGAAPFYRSPSGDVVLWRGDATAVLRALPAGSVHACITSPPYFALRAYNTEPQVWGGDASCAHEWGETLRTHWANSVPGPAGLEGKNGSSRNEEKYHGNRCARCGAWRGELGLQESPDEYVAALVAVFREVRRVLHPTGTVWLNIGDSYNSGTQFNHHSAGLAGGHRYSEGERGAWPGHRPLLAGLPAKSLLMMPSRVAIALQADGWWLRSMIPWLKRNAMPSSATDRPTTATEYVFLLSKRAHYFYDTTAVAVPSVSDHGSGNGYKRPQQLSRGGRGSDVPWSPQAARYRRDADWWFDSLRAILAGATGLLADEDGDPLALPVNPAAYPGAHFATFSPKLVEPMVLASTSARGCCGKCGTPWTRTTEREFVQTGPVRQPGETDASSGWPGFPRGTTRSETTGWRAGCACEAGPPIPCTVLDPFCGAGTVSLVARKHGRTSWGIDLSAAYLEMARERLGQLALPGLAAD